MRERSRYPLVGEKKDAQQPVSTTRVGRPLIFRLAIRKKRAFGRERHLDGLGPDFSARFTARDLESGDFPFVLHVRIEPADELFAERVAVLLQPFAERSRVACFEHGRVEPSDACLRQHGHARGGGRCFDAGRLTHSQEQAGRLEADRARVFDLGFDVLVQAVEQRVRRFAELGRARRGDQKAEVFRCGLKGSAPNEMLGLRAAVPDDQRVLVLNLNCFALTRRGRARVSGVLEREK